MHQIQPLENLIIAVLLQKYSIEQGENGRELSIEIKGRKLKYLESYIIRHELINHIYVNKVSEKVNIRSSIILERILKEWTLEGQLVAIEPNKLTNSVFMLWTCLFARNNTKHVVIDIQMEQSIRNTIKYFYQLIFDTKLIDKEQQFQFSSFTNILLNSYQRKGSIEETAELNFLLPERDRKKMKHILHEWEESYHNVF